MVGNIREFAGVRSFNTLRDVWRQLIYGVFSVASE
jgi:hypothetical protein